MDEKDNLFTVTNNDNLSENKDESINTDPAQSDMPEAPADTVPPQNNSMPDISAGSTPPPPPPVRQPKYDSFMYEPIGFEQYERQNEAMAREAAERLEKRRRTKSERLTVMFLLLTFGVTIFFAVFAIIRDIGKSDEFFGKDYEPPQKITVYHEKKPEGVNDDSNYVDENGKYTTEGIAKTVRPSIVEIYTYSDRQHSTPVGTGSGVIITKDGYIVTNAHVLQATGYHVVKTSDDKSYNAKIIGRDSKTDIAIIKISASDLQPAILGDSDEVVVGEQVMAIGNPAGLSGSVTDGIVSAVNRKIKADSTGFEMNCIQTNADISPGNSGGALVNMYGQVIGITSSKYVSSSYEGLGFAITINDAMPIIEQLIDQGYVSDRFKIGIQLVDMENESKIATIEEALGFELPEGFEGIYIADISEDCDIANTALEVGDFITEINGKTVTTYDELYDTISRQYGAGDTVPATCAHIDSDGNVEYYKINFKLMEDTSGDY